MSSKLKINEKMLDPLFSNYGKLIKSGEVIFNEGDESENFYIVYSGKVKIVLHEENDLTTTINVIAEGEIFGEMSLIDKKKRSASAIAIDDVKVIVLNETIFYSLMESKKDFVLSVFKTLVNRNIRLSDIAAKLSQRDEKLRVYISFANFIKSQMKNMDEPIVIDAPKIISKISNDINLSENKVIKYIDQLEFNNKIKYKDNQNLIIANIKKTLDFLEY